MKLLGLQFQSDRNYITIKLLKEGLLVPLFFGLHLIELTTQC
jgi:hypothetical protein